MKSTDSSQTNIDIVRAIKNRLKELFPNDNIKMGRETIFWESEYGSASIMYDRVRFPNNPYAYLRKEKSAEDFGKYIADNLSVLSNWNDNYILTEDSQLDGILFQWGALMEELKSKKKKKYDDYLPLMHSLLTTFADRLIQMTWEYAKMFGLENKLKNVTVHRTLRAWGQCYYQLCTISLHIGLIAASPLDIKEMVLHELCHLFHPSHRPIFFIELEKMCYTAGLIKKRGYMTKAIAGRAYTRIVTDPNPIDWDKFRLSEGIIKQFFNHEKWQSNVRYSTIDS